MAITVQEYEQASRKYRDELIRRATRSGPHYAPKGTTITWHDQYFDFEIDPVGVVNCPQAIRVGATMSSLDVKLIASHQNEGALVIPAGSTITLSLLQGDAENGTFEDIGPTVCVKAPAGGMEIERDDLVCRFPIGDFTKPWLMVSLEFSGAITGGTIDCALGYVPQ